MSWRAVARLDVLRARRSWTLWTLLVGYALLFGGAVYLQADSQGSVASLLVSTVYVFVPLTAFAIGYQSIAKRRQNGALRVVLSYPHTRRDVVVGTFVGRAAVLLAVLTVGFLTGAVVYAAEVAAPSVVALAATWAFAAAFSVSFVGLAVGLSAAVRTSNRAALLCFGAFLGFLGVWPQLPRLFRYVVNGFSVPRGPAPTWTVVFAHVNPIQAYRMTATALLPSQPLGTSLYTSVWFGLLVSAAWLAVPLVAGYARFARTDL